MSGRPIFRAGNELRRRVRIEFRDPGENWAFGIPVASGGLRRISMSSMAPFSKEVPMSSKQRRKLYGIRRERRRPRGWTRWFHEGLMDSEASGGVRLRTILWGKDSG
jgi:hypothetical protein